ncbi:unnamed protein product [Hymenolepis diminuta]|uniref:Uncharacterized protein n=1 Tax=Hymenolepis diminuta TaxID=6216 RepID=A0A564Y9X7_HYMDI|nr:unnamed protein product [Hymenolepis diminuta]
MRRLLSPSCPRTLHSQQRRLSVGNKQRAENNVNHTKQDSIFASWSPILVMIVPSSGVHSSSEEKKTKRNNYVFREEERVGCCLRYSTLPLVIKEKMWCADVNNADSGVLVIVGLEREQVSRYEAGLLTRLSSEGGEGRRWQWRPFTPMDGEHCGQLLAVYSQ